MRERPMYRQMWGVGRLRVMTMSDTPCVDDAWLKALLLREVAAHHQRGRDGPMLPMLLWERELSPEYIEAMLDLEGE